MTRSLQMNQSVQQKWEALRDSLRGELVDAVEVVVRIPGWQAVGIDQGLHWIQVSVFEGFYVAFRVDKSVASVTVWLKKWEYGENEPNWSDICVD